MNLLLEIKHDIGSVSIASRYYRNALTVINIYFLAQEAFTLMHLFSIRGNMLYENKRKSLDLYDYYFEQ